MSSSDSPFFFSGPLLQFLDTVHVATGGSVVLGGWNLELAENAHNPRQIDFTDRPGVKAFQNWELVRVTVGDFTRHAHLYRIGINDGGGRLILNCFAGKPIGLASQCGDHLMIMVNCRDVEAVERTAKKALFGGSIKLTGEVTAVVRSTSEPQMQVPVTIDCMGDGEKAAALATFIAARTSGARGISRTWPADLAVGVQRLEFPSASGN